MMQSTEQKRENNQKIIKKGEATMGMRKYLRKIAKANMMKQGIEKINKKHSVEVLANGKKVETHESKFANHWKEYV